MGRVSGRPRAGGVTPTAEREGFYRSTFMDFAPPGNWHGLRVFAPARAAAAVRGMDDKRPGETCASPGQAGAPATLPPTGHPSPLFGFAEGAASTIHFPCSVGRSGACCWRGPALRSTCSGASRRPGLCSSRAELKLRPIFFSSGPPEAPALSSRRTQGAASRRGRVEVAGPRPVGTTAPFKSLQNDTAGGGGGDVGENHYADVGDTPLRGGAFRREARGLNPLSLNPFCGIRPAGPAATLCR